MKVFSLLHKMDDIQVTLSCLAANGEEATEKLTNVINDKGLNVDLSMLFEPFPEHVVDGFIEYAGEQLVHLDEVPGSYAWEENNVHHELSYDDVLELLRIVGCERINESAKAYAKIKGLTYDNHGGSW